MKSSKKTKLAATPQTIGFPTINSLRPKPKAARLEVKPAKRDNIFSKSRDTREDRGTREVKSSQNARTFPHVR